jgi:riboflavin synthase
VEAGSETLSRTNLGRLAAGSPVNLERALRVGDRVGGHFVSGHIDCVAQLVNRRDEDEWSHFWFRLPHAWQPHLAAKGSVAVDGVSLTIVEVVSDTFSVALIPYTLAHTTLGQRAVGDEINIETDLLAKYVETTLAARMQ